MVNEGVSQDAYSENGASCKGLSGDAFWDHFDFRIDFNNHPRPVPILGALSGYNNEKVRYAAMLQLKFFNHIMHRHPTETEANALVYHSCKKMQILSAGIPLGVAGGLYGAYATADKGPLLFFKQKEGFDPNKFKILGKVIEGEAARNWYRTIRYGSYVGAGTLLSTVFFSVWANIVFAEGFATDKKLDPYRMKVIEEAERDRKERFDKLKRERNARLSNPQDNRGGQYQAPMAPVGRAPVAQQSNGSSSQEQAPSGWDDASQTGGAFSEVSTQFDSNMDNQSSSGSSQPASPTSNQSSQWNQQPSRPQPLQQSSPQSSRSFYDDDDDASPTAQPAPSSASDSAGGSAWDRIRKGQSVPPTQSPVTKQDRPRRQESSDTGSEAQREFDERVDRERRGESFGGSGRW